MNAKKHANLLRDAANKCDELAVLIDELDENASYAPRSLARLYRSAADNLDQTAPPQPEWHDGDFARSHHGGLWQFDGEWWHLGGKKLSTAGLNRDFGPIHKVHIADPARHEVVVSLDGIDRTALDHWADQAECSPRLWVQSKTAIRAAKAAREQLGEVQ